MNGLITIEIEVWLLLLSCLLPVFFILIHLFNRKPVSRSWLFFWGIVFVILGWVNMVVLRRLGEIVKKSMHHWDDVLFGPTYSVAFYILPILCAGIGINLITEVITSNVPTEKKTSPKPRVTNIRSIGDGDEDSQSAERPNWLEKKT